MMANLRLIHGTPPPDTPAERVRTRVRKSAMAHLPSCSTCGGHEYVVATIGKQKTKLCTVCLTQGRRREMS